ncbi:hypothetical protein H6G17_31350 [Chroococcidiopsis sp. FACHB-1243]|uniref:FAD-binding oxidoreductase n=1 Tax=Chroococcidiopsis sp. [FACHB-1243] TaxID=2692781 RepID=UPI00177ED9E5|nr:hypothetical protein [Chroococcidiopsis sp. [FACHB-1243]]
MTIISGAIAGIVNPKDKFTSQLGVYTSLIGTGCGAIFGLVLGNKSRERKSPAGSQERETRVLSNGIWQDWRNFVIVCKVKESEEITSFYLEPEDRGKIPHFQPGQFLTIKLNISERDRHVICTYSLSDYKTTNKYYRLLIKQEPMPPNLDVPAGIASNFMHDRIFAGDVISVKPPSGNFILDVNDPLPAVLISNGVGIAHDRYDKSLQFTVCLPFLHRTDGSNLVLQVDIYC